MFKSNLFLLSALFSALALAQNSRVLLTFDDIQVSNDDGCGDFQPTEISGFFSSDNNGILRILNTTKTPSCQPPDANNLDILSPFGFAVSSPNVAAARIELDLQIITGSFVNSVNYTIGVQLNETELASNLVIQVFTATTDFNNNNNNLVSTFNTLSDGPGPHSISITDIEPAILFSANADLVTPKGQFIRHLVTFLDNFEFETAPGLVGIE